MSEGSQSSEDLAVGGAGWDTAYEVWKGGIVGGEGKGTTRRCMGHGMAIKHEKQQLNPP